MSEKRPLSTLERALIRLDESPWDAVWRTIVGVLWSAAVSRVAADALAPAQLMWFVGLLVALRLVPLVLRRVLPLSREVKVMWSERRLLAQRYDSYQWKKVLWLGVGIGLQTGWSGGLMTARGLIAAACIAAGGCGWFAWQVRTSRARAVQASAQ